MAAVTLSSLISMNRFDFLFEPFHLFGFQAMSINCKLTKLCILHSSLLIIVLIVSILSMHDNSDFFGLADHFFILTLKQLQTNLVSKPQVSKLHIFVKNSHWAKLTMKAMISQDKHITSSNYFWLELIKLMPCVIPHAKST